MIDPCGHMYCRSCIYSILDNTNRCPYSNKSMKKDDLILNKVLHHKID